MSSTSEHGAVASCLCFMDGDFQLLNINSQGGCRFLLKKNYSEKKERERNRSVEQTFHILSSVYRAR